MPEIQTRKFSYLFALILLIFSGCSILPRWDYYWRPSGEELQDITRAVDYNRSYNWVIRETGNSRDTEVDIFIAYPTIVSYDDLTYMDWSDERTNDRAQWFVPQMAEVFSPVGRIFAPFYRQTEYRKAIKAISGDTWQMEIFQRGIEDLRNAFRNYLENYNQGRPFILFGHSQGSMALLELMRHELKDPDIRSRLVAAYLIGYPKMPKSFPDAPHLQLAKGSFDTGVIINWNSVAPRGKEKRFTGGNYYCINPLNWRTDDLPAPENLSKGAVFFDKNGKTTGTFVHFCSTQIDPERGALVVTPPKNGVIHPALKSKGNFHTYDIFFFYRDLTENAKLRVKAFYKH